MITGILESKKIVSQVAPQPNTYIGGVAASIPDAATLASILNISESNISYFAVKTNDIEAKIEVNYSLPDSQNSLSFWRENPDLTYYLDIDGKVTSIGFYVFYKSNKIEDIQFPNATSIGANSLVRTGKGYSLIYIPEVLTLGTNTTNESVFSGINTNATIYINSYLQTANAGSEEGDIAYARSQGATIVYVQNYTKPSTITDLSIGTIYATALQLNFTPPTGSVNTIEFYECYANGVYKNKINGSGGYITGLNPNTHYNIEVKPVDTYYNKSTSNIVAQITNATEPYPVGSITSYYKKQNDVLDSFGTNHGIPTAIAYAAGMVGQSAVFNGTTSKIVIPNDYSLSFTDGANDLPFTLITIFKTNNVGANQMLINKLNTLREYFLYFTSGQVRIQLEGGGAISRATSGFSFVNGQEYIIAVTYDGSKLHTGLKIYINGLEATTANLSSGTYTGMVRGNNNLVLGMHGNETSGIVVNGSLDETVIVNGVCWTPTEVSEATTKLQSGQSLI